MKTNPPPRAHGNRSCGSGPLLPASTARAQTAQLGVAPANSHRYKIGSYEVTAILDFTRPAEKPETIFGTDQKPEDVAALLEANFLPTTVSLNMFTPVVVNTGKELVLFDTGLGAAAGGQLPQRLAAAGIAPDQINVVVITHCHPDHIGGLAADGKPTFQMPLCHQRGRVWFLVGARAAVGPNREMPPSWSQQMSRPSRR